MSPLFVPALLALAAAAAAAAAQPPIVALDVDFPSFLARADPLWSWSAAAPPPAAAAEWVGSLFGGNGELGFYVFFPSPTRMRMEISRQSLYDDRNASLGQPAFLDNFVFDAPRLPVGYFDITWASGAPALNVTGRLSLHDARATIAIATAAGSLSLAAWASADFAAADVIVLEFAGAGGEAPLVTFVPELAQSTWSGQDARYVPNPPPANASTTAGAGLTLNTTTQRHLAGTAHSTAVLAGAGALFASVSPTLASPAAADAHAQAQVAAAQAMGLAALRAAHEAWWHAWWPAGGFITTEFSIAEGFFYLQMYKLGSAARAGRSVHALEGPWFIPGTDWPDLHWDLNLRALRAARRARA